MSQSSCSDTHELYLPIPGRPPKDPTKPNSDPEFRAPSPVGRGPEASLIVLWGLLGLGPHGAPDRKATWGSGQGSESPKGF